MSTTMTVEGRTIGGRRPLFPDFDFDLPFPDEESFRLFTLRMLITAVVKVEVESFQARHEAQKVVRALTEMDIQHGLMRGKVDSGGRDLGQNVNTDEAVDAAIQAFEDGIYYVFVDDDQKTDLDAPFALGSKAKLTFLRLVALAGG